MRDATPKIAIALAALLLAPLLHFAVIDDAAAPEAGAYTVPGLDPITPDAARDELFTLLPALLVVVYDAFGRTDEAEIYDTLAAASDGEALEALYLERAGAMVGGGLTETDQEIHEMRLITATSQHSGETFQLDAAWEVIGTVGHTEHMHVRGNTYHANLTIAPVDGAWKITGFELTDVDRGTAGELIEAERSWWN